VSWLGFEVSTSLVQVKVLLLASFLIIELFFFVSVGKRGSLSLELSDQSMEVTTHLHLEYIKLTVSVFLYPFGHSGNFTLM
jgi:hypothetical protein